MKYTIDIASPPALGTACPFCGYKLTKTFQFSTEENGSLTHDSAPVYGAQCCNCKAIGPLMDTKPGATNHWESRHSDITPKATTIVNQRQLTLGELIGTLKLAPPDRPIVMGLRKAHSYRGIYENVAFQIGEETNVKAMLAEACKGLDTFTAWKGGDYTMTEKTPVWIANIGETGWPLTDALLMAMMAGVTE